jgi:antitoxin component of RelBE/YafQ-DinJ toxin-antitoxin module
MGSDMSLQYSIKIKFDERLLEKPERVFEAMGFM